MTGDEVRVAYGAQVRNIVDMLGTQILADDPDRAIIEPWAETVPGRILDVGSGTGRWTGHLTNLGHDVEGIEPAAELVAIARHAHPDVPFHVAAIADLEGTETPSLATKWEGILAWYSLIHMGPAHLPDALATLRKVLDADGTLLLSFFAGNQRESFNHPVALAYRWPTDHMTALLDAAGFEVLSQSWNPPAPHAFMLAKATP